MTPQQQEKLFSPWKLAAAQMTQKEQEHMEATMTVFLRDHPFFAYVMMDRLDLIWTRDVPTAATDGVANVWVNPEYFLHLTMQERIFGLCHEILHVIYEHIPRDNTYEIIEAIKGVKYDRDHANNSQDARINEDLIESNVGSFNKEWIRDPNIKKEESYEDVYIRTYQKKPPGSGGQQGQGQGGAGGQGSNQPTPGTPRAKNQNNAFNGNGFDQHLPAPVDKKTGEPVKPDTQGMKETVLQAASHAKAMGSMPAGLMGFIDKLRDPQVPWEDHLQFQLSTVLGAQEMSYSRPHRRRISMSFGGFQTVWPGPSGRSAGTIVAAADTSGSMGDKEKSAAVSEFCGILEMCRPKEMYIMWCDAAVGRVDHVNSVDEMEDLLRNGVPGGGGTDFRPVFDKIEKEGLDPAAVVFITDGYGTFPKTKPGYPVFWVMTTDVKAPFGETLRVTVE